MTNVLLRKEVKVLIKMTVLALLGLLVSTKGKSQDIHFSQWMLNPLEFNPAMTGFFNADLRVSMTYRNQWPGLAPFKTYKVAGDGAFTTKQKGKTKLSLGGMVYKDVAGDADLSNFQMTMYVGTIMELTRNSDLSVAINGGLLQRSLSPADMIWDAQYVGGQYSATNPTYESSRAYVLNTGDVGAGVAYRYQKDAATLSSNDHLQFVAGLGMQHLNRPTIALTGGDDRMYGKFTLHSDLDIGIKNTNIALRPGIFYAKQGPYKEIVAGTYFTVLMREGSKRTGFISAMKFSLGTHVRLGDAFIPSVFIEVDKYKLGISYDTTLSSLKTANQGKGGIEITFIFTNPSTFYYKRNQPKGTPML
jgi:type IX secretion system PorP/SprF family membrane protein